MKQALFLCAASLIAAWGYESQAAQPFTPIVGVGIGLESDACIGYDGDVFDTEPEIDYFSSECAGFGGWRVLAYGGDIRSFVKLRHGQYEIDLQEAMTPVGQFPNVGDVLEFRVRRTRRVGTEPFAAIVAVSGQDPDDYEKTLQNVLVVKLNPTKSCVMQTLPVGPEGLEQTWTQARAIADARAEAHVCP